jgi:hypothetical protein
MKIVARAGRARGRRPYKTIFKSEPKEHLPGGADLKRAKAQLQTFSRQSRRSAHTATNENLAGSGIAGRAKAQLQTFSSQSQRNTSREALT